jgi:LemA protein
MKKLALVFLAIFVVGCGYNTLQRRDEQVKAAWSQVLNLYQKRADLIPNLVKIVQGYATHEKDTLTAVIEARAKATSVNVKAEDADSLKKFAQAQGEFSSALSRLMVVVEKYPDLKANQGFLQLQNDLKGVEQQIAKARKDYIREVQNYNIVVRSFPTNITASWAGHTVKPTFTVEDEKGISKAPVISFK